MIQEMFDLNDIPPEVREAAERIEHWAKANNLREWRLGGVCSPHYVEAQPGGKQHSDNIAIDMFAKALKRKMAKKREDGRDGWEFCTADTLSAMLHAHVRKGDPVDVANFCMMLWCGRNGIAADKWIKPGFDECVASGQSCSYGDEGPNGEAQCKYCGKQRPTLVPEQSVEKEKCEFCGATVENPCETPPPYMCEKALAATLDTVGNPVFPARNSYCNRPSVGWVCTRHEGHTGPCAAVSIGKQSGATE